MHELQYISGCLHNNFYTAPICSITVTVTVTELVTEVVTEVVTAARTAD